MIFPELKQFAVDIKKDINGTLYLVGGAVRDMLLGQQPKDFDCELFNIMPSDFEKYLNEKGIKFKFNSDAKFPVYRINLIDNFLDEDKLIEVGFPRKDNKTGPKHSDYDCIVDPFMSIEEAADRRDFTINACYYNIWEGKHENTHFHKDLQSYMLVPVSNKFNEDAIRIMRAFQLISRFNLVGYGRTINAITTDMANELFNIDPSGIYAEFVKGITKAKNIKPALDFLGHLRRIEFFKIVGEMEDCPQNEWHHAEGNVWNHTTLVIRNAISLGENDYEKILLFFAAFFHDVGKMKTLAYKDGKPTAYGHDIESDDLVLTYAQRFGLPKKMISQILMLKKHHMIHNNISNKKLNYIAEELKSVGLSFKTLCKLMLADTYGSIKNEFNRTVKSHECIYSMINKLIDLGIYENPLPPYITGEMILMASADRIKGKQLGMLLKECKDIQYVGRFKGVTDAIEFMNRRIVNIIEKQNEKVVDNKNQE